jgi:hypothetical protein
MVKLQRVRIINQQIIEVSAAQAWAWLTDWAGSEHPLNGATLNDLPLASVTLIGEPDEVPRTREIDWGPLGVLRETLLYQDDETMHLRYNIEDTGPFGLRNYLATTDVDEVSPSCCQITITARFDVPPGGDLLKAQAVINQGHNDIVIEGIRRFFLNA